MENVPNRTLLPSCSHLILFFFRLVQDTNARRKLLDTVLKKATLYSNVLARQLDENKAALRATAETRSKGRHPNTKGGRKRCRVDSDESDDDDSYNRKNSKKSTSRDDVQEEGGAPRLKQPALITGAKMKDYQLEGLEWMIGLDQNGISGILGGCPAANMRYGVLNAYV